MSVVIKSSRWIGAAAATSVILLWIAFFNPYGAQGLGPGTYLVVAAMLALAVAGLIAALKVKPVLLLVIAVASFVPVGLYLLGTPGVFRWIGAFDIVLLVVGLG